MSTVSIADMPGRAVGRVRVTDYKKIETPDLSNEAAVKAIFDEAARIAKSERSRRAIWRRKTR